MSVAFVVTAAVVRTLAVVCVETVAVCLGVVVLCSATSVTFCTDFGSADAGAFVGSSPKLMSASVAEVLFSFELSAEVAVSDFVSVEVSVLVFVVVVSVLSDVIAVVSAVVLSLTVVVTVEVGAVVCDSDVLLSPPLQPQSSKQPSRAAAINLYLIFVPFIRKAAESLRRLDFIRM